MKPAVWFEMAILTAVFVFLLGIVSARILDIPEEGQCVTLGKEEGTCTLLSKCRDPGDFKRDHPPICSFRGNEPIICCPKPISIRASVGKKANLYCTQNDQMCSFNAKRTKRQIQTSGDRTTTTSTTSGTTESGTTLRPIFIKQFVHNGKLSAPRIHRHMVLIGYGEEDQKEWSCGGSLITSKFVLSAAHCAQPELLGPAKWARLGDLDISTSQDDASIQDYIIVDRILHPGYKPPQVYNDIAVFKLDQDAVFTPWVAPICLQTEKLLPDGPATVTGWGRVEFAGGTSNHLLEADLDVFNDTECRRLLPYTDNKTPRGIDSNLMFCAGKRDGSKDACSGDSGGPLAIAKQGMCLKTQIGITSYGSQCGLPDSPGVYTRVSEYISWIEEIAFIDEQI